MRGASVLIALAGIAVFSLGFIKLAQNSFVQPVSVQYSHLAKHTKTLGAGENINYSDVVGGKAVLLKFAKSLAPTVSDALVRETTSAVGFGTRNQNTRSMTVSKDKAEQLIKLLLSMISKTLTEDQIQAAWQQVQECANGGVVIDGNYGVNNYIRDDGFHFGISLLAVDCKGPVSVAAFTKAKAGEFRKQEITKQIKYYQQGRFMDTEVSFPATIKVPAVVTDALKQNVEIVAKYQLFQDLIEFASS